ncbi:MAG: aspartyl protease family protein [Planctomycetota bacterium]|jgi:predicted aspartyl protease
MKVSISFTRGTRILVPVRIRNGVSSQRPVMLHDTGARRTLITPGLAAGLGFEPGKFEETTRIVGAITTASAGLLTLDSVSVLGLEVAGLRVLCHPLPAALGVQGVIGLDYLNHFRVVIDGPAEKVTISERTQ